MTYPTSSRKKLDPTAKQNVERLQALAGERKNDTPEQEAVTQGSASGLGTIALTAAILTASPAMADYNKLVADTRALASVLNAMGAKITWS